ncbi:MAG: LPS export ABC transporter periplasmic protein LptC [Bacteroidales bacterium]|nr:LPS export ABC transporter periplasmic protein LptC [Bacteroidales bacterium]
MSLYSCKDKNDNLVAFTYDPDSVPTLITRTTSQLISDSGITRYRIVTDLWKVFDKAEEPYWYFPEGIYFEQFTPDFEIEATVEADTAWYYNVKDLWKLKRNVHVENRQGEQFDSEELFWDGKNEKVFSEAYIEIKGGLTELKGYGFESNQTMTDYRIFRPHDGKLPFSETIPPDSLQSDAWDEEMTEMSIPDSEGVD